ncbi:hypothetical protein [Paenibacillus rigui]|uniref:Uncharacterized protein n=1 Tax=Paenibacillus rigui TaxID=554312 RepID=A0A229UWN2_9BACL|nr:hypothetical protein [Paenibacillus rigui]OXM87862.1 hypothetical protein CF651_01765 [Paenibacillus rigui]
MNSCYKVRACCSTAHCDYVHHSDVIQTINHESSFSFAMMMNEWNTAGVRMKCPQCGQPMFFYPVSYIADPVTFA